MMASEIWNNTDKATRLRLVLVAARLFPFAWEGALLQYRALATWEQLTEFQRKALIQCFKTMETRAKQRSLFVMEDGNG